jgi:hypothetical protein
MKRKGAQAPLAVGQLRVAHAQIYTGNPQLEGKWIMPGEIFVVLKLCERRAATTGTFLWVEVGLADKTVCILARHYAELLSDLISDPN